MNDEDWLPPAVAVVGLAFFIMLLNLAFCASIDGKPIIGLGM